MRVVVVVVVGSSGCMHEGEMSMLIQGAWELGEGVRQGGGEVNGKP